MCQLCSIFRAVPRLVFLRSVSAYRENRYILLEAHGSPFLERPPPPTNYLVTVPPA